MTEAPPVAPQTAPATQPAQVGSAGIPEVKLAPTSGTGMRSKNPAMQRVSESLRKSAVLDETGNVAATEKKEIKPELKQAVQDKQAKEEKSEIKPTTEQTKEPTNEEVKPVETKTEEKDKKVNPWQLKEKWEKTAKTLEAENAKIRQQLAQAADAKSVLERAEKAESRLKELEDTIRHVDYTKSEEYVNKYQKPLEQAWVDASNDLKEITVAEEDGSSRAATLQDLTILASLPLGEARKLANERFGDLANDVMAHRSKIVELARQQQKALDESKKTGSELEKQTTLARQQAVQETAKLWEEYHKADIERDPFLQPKEGDAEWNEALEKSQKYVNEAFGKSATDPKLTPEERAKIVRQHANIRARAIAHKMMSVENTRLKAELETVKKSLEQFKKGEPTAGEGKTVGTESKGLNAMDRIKARIRGAAK